MENTKGPDFGHGKICYIEVPTVDIEQSAAFFQKVFGWDVRTRGDGSVAFDDGVGQVSGTWVKGLKPLTEGTLMVHIMVDNAAETLDAITANGGIIVEPIGRHSPEITARFTDPGGNIWGIYQHRG